MSRLWKILAVSVEHENSMVLQATEPMSPDSILFLGQRVLVTCTELLVGFYQHFVLLSMLENTLVCQAK